MQGLKTLKADRNGIVDLSPLADLKSLERISLAGNRIERIEALAQNPSLLELDASGNSIKVLPVFSQGLKVQSLLLARNRISDVTPLVGPAAGSMGTALRRLTTLDLAENAITDASIFNQRLTDLNFLTLKGNPLVDARCPLIFSTYCVMK